MQIAATELKTTSRYGVACALTILAVLVCLLVEMHHFVHTALSCVQGIKGPAKGLRRAGGG
jgi:hypothetical protein